VTLFREETDTMSPMNPRLMRPRRSSAQNQPAFGYDVVTSYNSDIFFKLSQDLTPGASFESFPVILNLIELASFHNAYYLPFTCNWTISAAVYDPPVSPNSFLNYYAVDRNPGERWGLPFGSEGDAHVTDTSTFVNYNWPGQDNRSLIFNENGECVTVYKLLGEDNPWSAGRSMATTGGVEVLWYTRQYKISQDPARGAAWVIRRELTLYNDEGKLQDLDPYSNHSWVDNYYFATGYAAADMGANSPITDSYTPDVGNFPSVLSGGPPSGGWSNS